MQEGPAQHKKRAKTGGYVGRKRNETGFGGVICRVVGALPSADQARSSEGGSPHGGRGSLQGSKCTTCTK